MRNLAEIDTIVCPATEDGFNEVFLRNLIHVLIDYLDYLQVIHELQVIMNV